MGCSVGGFNGFEVGDSVGFRDTVVVGLSVTGFSVGSFEGLSTMGIGVGYSVGSFEGV